MSAGIPDPAEHTSWPAWFYPPGTAEEDPAAHGQIFERADDVPEGWAADWRAHGANLDQEPPQTPAPTLSRKDLKEALTARDIPFSPTLGIGELQRLLDEANEAEALEAQV